MTPSVPLYATKRTDRPSDGRMVADIAVQLGLPLMEWQQRVVDVGLERDRDGGGYAYRNVTITTPRQAGKSTMSLALILFRLMAEADRVVLYAAQNRMAARTKLLDGWWPTIRSSPYADEFTLSRGAGFEALRCSNGSVLRILSSEESSGHGESVDLVLLDECWALEAHVEQAVRPATIRRPDAQIWSVSTAGTTRSVWWRGKVDVGREAAAGATTGTAYFEWSAPLDADPADPDTWRACHPALAEGVVDQDVIAADYDAMPAAEFGRAYLNWWSDDLTDSGWNVIAEDVWKAARA